MTRLIYHLFIGLPVCVVLCAVGCLLCATVIGIPFGLATFAVAFKAV